MGGKFFMPIDTAHAFATTARHSLDENGIANLCGCLLEHLQRLCLPMISRYNWNADLLHQRLCSIFKPHGPNSLSGRSDPDQACLLHRLSKFRVL